MFYVTYALLWLVAILQGLAILFLVRRIGDVPAQEQPTSEQGELPVGSRAPSFIAREPRTGRAVNSSTLLGQRTVLLLLSADCTSCRTILGGLGSLPRESAVRLVMYCSSSGRRCERYVGDVQEIVRISADDEPKLSDRFRVQGLPAAVILDAAGNIVSYQYPKTLTDLEQCLQQRSIQGAGTLADAPLRHAEVGLAAIQAVRSR